MANVDAELFTEFLEYCDAFFKQHKFILISQEAHNHLILFLAAMVKANEKTTNEN